MNFYAISMILMALIACVTAFPSNNDYGMEEHESREKGLTCDLFSWGGKVGHTACAAKCLAMGKVGGTCSRGMCRCRKEKIRRG